jgi:uncharacterized membrane protein YkoI
MQKFILFLILCLSAGYHATAQKTPPAVVVTAFNQKFGAVTELEWDKEKNGAWEAEFEQKGQEMSANFSADGKWLETETEIQFTDLPAPVQAALKGKKVKETAKILKADGTTVYEAEVKRKDLIFDATGKLLSDDKG